MTTEPATGQTTARPRGPARLVAVLAALGLLGSLLMALSHAGIVVPGLAALGPQGQVIAPVAAGFAAGTLAFAAVAVAAWAQRPWAWPLALVINALALVSAAFPWRGTLSTAAIAVTGVALIVLLSPAGRRSLLGARDGRA